MCSERLDLDAIALPQGGHDVRLILQFLIHLLLQGGGRSVVHEHDTQNT